MKAILEIGILFLYGDNRYYVRTGNKNEMLNEQKIQGTKKLSNYKGFVEIFTNLIIASFENACVRGFRRKIIYRFNTVYVNLALKKTLNESTVSDYCDIFPKF